NWLRKFTPRCVAFPWRNNMDKVAHIIFGKAQRSLLWLLLVLSLNVRLLASPAAIVNNKEYLIDAWETGQGLPENSATAMVQTADGYLWFGTFNGLVRFDGVRFTVFNPSNTPELPSAGIANLHLDQTGRIWISTLRGLVVRTDDQWKTVGVRQGWAGD